MKFNNFYFREHDSIDVGDVVSITNDKNQYVVITTLNDDEIEVADIETKENKKIVNLKDVVGIQQDIFGDKISTDPIVKPKIKPVKTIKSKPIKTKQLDLFN